MTKIIFFLTFYSSILLAPVPAGDIEMKAKSARVIYSSAIALPTLANTSFSCTSSNNSPIAAATAAYKSKLKRTKAYLHLPKR